MSVLESVQGPDDLRRLPAAALPLLADEIRAFLVDAVTRTGGHLGPNLGVVELTIALHRVFASPRDRILWDTGHQAYVHKLLTGRAGAFAGLRQPGGLSGYPNSAESAHDLVENSHASTALSYADGLAKAAALAGTDDRAVVAVVGDGALTGGLAWEALNNLGSSDRPVVVVLNDNGRSYAPTVGGLARHLSTLRGADRYGDVLALLRGRPAPVHPAPRSLFEQLGLDYLGPVDGHDVGAVEGALRAARSRRRPVVVHCVTVKGRGYPAAEGEPEDRMHTIGQLDPATGAPTQPRRRTWTDVFADELVEIGADRPDVVAVTAAMPGPTGLRAFAAAHPDRCFDVGIAEQHAVASAAGLAMAGRHPVVAVYATFLNRAFDQVLLDVALHELPVTFVLDRAGITGPDGPSHHGMWDLAMLQLVPGLRIAAPRDAATLRAELREAVAVGDGPTVVRFPKQSLGPDLPAVATLDGLDVLRGSVGACVVLVAVGTTAATCVAAARLLERVGVATVVVDPRWVVPVHPALVRLAAAAELVVTVEDGVRSGGVGSAVALALQAAQVETPVRTVGLPRGFIPHGERAALLETYGVSAAGVSGVALDALRGTGFTRSQLVPLDSVG